MSAMGCVMRRDLLAALRRRSDLATTLVFFAIVASLFPLGIGPEAKLLRGLAPGVLWVAALLASLLALNRLFAADYADGTLEQLLLAPQPLSVLVLAKITAHWLTCGLPLIALAPLLALQFDLAQDVLPVLLVSLLLGTPVLSLIGAVASAVDRRASRAGPPAPAPSWPASRTWTGTSRRSGRPRTRRAG